MNNTTNVTPGSPANYNPQQHNYMKKIIQLKADGKIELDVANVYVSHDTWCAVYKGGYCNCNPDIKVNA